MIPVSQNAILCLGSDPHGSNCWRYGLLECDAA